VLPGATATEFWRISGTPVEELPAHIVMNAEDLVDAALAGFDLGETVTVPSLPESSDWDTFEANRLVLQPKLSRSVPAERYRVTRSTAQS
jgi:short-subunit dehydrogenase